MFRSSRACWALIAVLAIAWVVAMVKLGPEAASATVDTIVWR